MIPDAPMPPDSPGRGFGDVGPWGMTPAWILSPKTYLPGVPDPSALKKGDEKPLNGSELRVYVSMRSFSDPTGFCKAYVQTIADRAEVDKSTAERAISKFRRLGWLTTKRHYRDDGSIRRCDYFLRNPCPVPTDGGYPSNDGEGVPVSSRVGSPRDDGKGTREVTGAKNTPDEHTKRTGNGVECLPSSRFAPSGPGDESDDHEPLILEAPTTKSQGFTDWRAEDYDLFLMLLGSEEVISHGGAAGKAGTYPARSLYDGMQKMPGKPKDWPGRYLDGIYARDPDSGIRGWLAQYDLEPG